MKISKSSTDTRSVWRRRSTVCSSRSQTLKAGTTTERE